MKSQTTALVALIAGLVGAAAELQAVGAIRPDHETKWGALRVALDQANDAAQALDKAADEAAPTTPDAAAFEQLGHQVETLALTVDSLQDEIAALRAEKA